MQHQFAKRGRQERIVDVKNEQLTFASPIQGVYDTDLPSSFIETVQPLVTEIVNIEAFAIMSLEFAKSVHTPESGLSVDEIAAVNIYTREWLETEKSLYHVLNSKLRQQNRRGLKPFFPYLRLLCDAVLKLRSVHQGVVWRGVGQNLSEFYPKGKKCFWWGLSSCTTDMQAVSAFTSPTGRTLFCIHCRNGVKIRSYSVYSQEEEVLLLPGIYFEVCPHSYISFLPRYFLIIMSRLRTSLWMKI